jgi:RHS repeat-associated protein
MLRLISRRSVRPTLCAAIALLLSVAAGNAPAGAVPEQSAGPGGQSVTILPDGRRLLIGGDATRRLVALEDPATGAVVTLAVSPLVPRTWHTATLLADGTVLIVGGIDAQGRTISAPERFNPTTRTFEIVPSDGFAARARHTATLLTDGQVLLVGGETIGGGSDAELWAADTQSSMPLNASMLQERLDHHASLLGDGRVLIQGGQTRSGAQLTDEVFDPVSRTFARQGMPVREPELVSVAATAPVHDATDVPVNVRLAIRFTSSMAPASLTRASVSLNGPAGAVDLVLVPAEFGRLAFAWPVAPLAHSTLYRLSIDGPVTDDSRALRRFEMTFTTAAADDSAGGQTESEDWNPDTRSRRGWKTDRSDSSWQTLPPLQGPPGATAVAGQALTLNGQPLPDVSLTIRGEIARTDKTGRFLLVLNDATSARHQLEIEGATANRPGRTYGFYEVAVKITAGQTNVLPYTIWMSKIDTARAVTIASPTTGEVVITTPRIPGLELHLPRGTVIRDRQGRVVREISITPIPIDRPPFPLPPDIDVPVYFTIQPGGAFVYSSSYGVRKARLIYPNYYDTPKGVIASFWHYDPEELGWYVYGAGKVTGTQVVPDPGVGLYEFTGAMMETSAPPPPKAPALFGGPAAGDPVDVATGLFVLNNTDLFLPDVLPIALTRTYRQGDSVSRPFGIGSSHPYAMRLWSAQMYQEADLMLPDGARIHYVRISPGTGYWDAVYEHTATPSPFYKSRIVNNGDGWDVTLRDGTVYVIGDVAPLQAIRDRFGNTTRIHHANGQSGNVTRVSSDNGRWIAFTYDTSNRITEARDNINRTVGYQYDASGRLWKVTDPAGRVTEYTYDSSHRMLTIKDARNIVYLTNTYDANGRIATQTQADSTTWEFDYTVDGSGKVTQADVTDPRGHVTRSTFNSNGYQLTSVEALGLSEERTTTYTRDATSNRISSVTNPLNRQTDYAYDTNGHITSVTRLAGTVDAVTSTFTYSSSFDHIASVTDPLSKTTAFVNDSLGRLTTVTDPLGHETAFTYDAAGRPLTVSNDLAETVQLTYDHGDPVSVTNSLGHSSHQYFDAGGRVVQAADPLGRTVQYEYSVLNQVTKVTDPLGGQTTFTYDANGNLVTLTDARNKTTTWTYDNMDRVAMRSDPLSRQESFGYDANGNLTTLTDRKGQVKTYQYDALDRQTFVGYGTTGTPPTYASTTTTTYDAGNRATDVADSIAGTSQRTYDLLDRLTQEVTPEGTVDYTFDTGGRRSTMTVAGQAGVSYTYDDANRLTAVAQGTATVSMVYDNTNRRTSLTLPNGVVVEYAYDGASQLAGLTYKLGGTTLGTLVYTYDPHGERTSVGGTYSRVGLPAALASASYDDANQIATFGGTSFSYDANGSLTSDGSQSYTWNARNQLTGIGGGVSATFSYDGVGRRRTATVSTGTTQFLYDGVNPVQELASGTPTANFLTGLHVDEYFTRTDATTTRQYLTDALGGSLALTDGVGTVQAEYTYEPFGEMTVSGASAGNTFGFTGREADGTGLFFYRARYYDPRQQRFISEDPVGFNAGVNMFAYVGNDPTRYVDPFGLKPHPGMAGWRGAGPGNRPGAPGAPGARPRRRPTPKDLFSELLGDIGRSAGPMADPMTYAEVVTVSAVGGLAGLGIIAAAPAVPAAGAWVEGQLILWEALTDSGTAYLTDIAMGIPTGPVLVASEGSMIIAGGNFLNWLWPSSWKQ